jgi:hypothetical protein
MDHDIARKVGAALKVEGPQNDALSKCAENTQIVTRGSVLNIGLSAAYLWTRGSVLNIGLSAAYLWTNNFTGLHFLGQLLLFLQYYHYNTFLREQFLIAIRGLLRLDQPMFTFSRPTLPFIFLDPLLEFSILLFTSLQNNMI